MTEKEKKAIKRCKQIIKDNNEVIKEARKNRDINSMQLTASLDNDSIAIEILLNLLEKQGKMIDEMANKLVEAHGWFYSEFDNYTKEDFKQYFENKVNRAE